MAERITIIGKAAKRIEVIGKEARKIDPAWVAEQLGAEPIDRPCGPVRSGRLLDMQENAGSNPASDIGN